MLGPSRILPRILIGYQVMTHAQSAMTKQDPSITNAGLKIFLEGMAVHIVYG